MAGPRGRKNPALAEALREEPWRFSFMQAVRLLDASARHGRGGEKGVRFRATDTLAFPPAEVEALADGASGTPEMTLAFLGLTGPLGVLPQHYTELLRQTRREHNPAFADFLDLFNRRIGDLFAQVLAKYRLGLSFEQAERASADGPDPVTAVLQALVGLHGVRLPQGAGLDASTLVHYSGHLSQRRASAAALKAILADDLRLPVRIEQFRGSWLLISPDEQSRLGGADGAGAFCMLGIDAVVGERSWDVQGRFRIVLGPMGYDDFASLLPGSPRLRRLVEIVRFQIGPGLGFDVQPVLARDEVPGGRLVSDGSGAARLGWNTWLWGEGREQDADDAVFEGGISAGD
jgi:type VI secretion system protein ImpH